MALVTWFASFVLSKWVLPKDDCFETSVGLFGQCCGVLATGLLLLKVVDPDFQTNAATNITSSSTLGYTYQLQYTLVFIALIMTQPDVCLSVELGTYADTPGSRNVFREKVP